MSLWYVLRADKTRQDKTRQDKTLAFYSIFVVPSENPSICPCICLCTQDHFETVFTWVYFKDVATLIAVGAQVLEPCEAQPDVDFTPTESVAQEVQVWQVGIFIWLHIV